MKNILFIGHSNGTTGAENVLCNVIKQVSQTELYNIHVALPKVGSHQFEKKIDVKPVYFYYQVARSTFVLFWRNIGFSLLFGLVPLLKYCKANKIDLIYVNTSVNIIGILVSRLLKIRYIWHIHEQSNASFRWTPKFLRPWLKKSFNNILCKSVFVSETCRSLWEQEIGDQIYNSVICYPPFKKVDRHRIIDEYFTFGFLGGLTPNKNIETLIKAYLELDIPNKRLIICGYGELNDYLRSKYSDQVEFMDGTNDVAQFYNLVDVVVTPSFNESFGLVTLEALWCGVAAIMTKNSGLVEIFEDKESCFFIDPYSVSELKDAMYLLANNQDLRNKLIQNAQKIINKVYFSINNITDLIATQLK